MHLNKNILKSLLLALPLRPKSLYLPDMFNLITHRIGVNRNVLNNRRTRIKTAGNSVFDCNSSPVGQQMTVETSVSYDFFYLRSSI